MNKENRNQHRKLFQIVHIKAGWFDVSFSNGLDENNLTNSWYLNNDAPKILLSNLVALSNEENEIWLCWHDEPGAYILNIKKDIDIATISISTTIKSAFELSFEGETLKDAEIDEQLLTFSTSITKLVKEIYLEFSQYSFGSKLNLYENEWGEFPMQEYIELEETIKNDHKYKRTSHSNILPFLRKNINHL